MEMPVTAIVAAHNEANSIENVLRQLAASHVNETIVVANGCTDDTIERAQRLAAKLPYPLILVPLVQAAGHDVPRAMGTFCALRSRPGPQLLLYIDADWLGSFAPMLRELLEFSRVQAFDVLSLTWSALSKDAVIHQAAHTWRLALQAQQVVPPSAVPFALPLLIHSQTFQRLSALNLAHPGYFFTAVVSAHCRWLTYDNWQMHLIGHRSRSRAHTAQIGQRIEMDGRLAHQLLTGQKNTAETDIPALPRRDFRTLLDYAAGLRLRL